MAESGGQTVSSAALQAPEALADRERIVPIAVFASGNGSNLEAILRACSGGRLAARVVGVVCNKPGAGAIGRAERFGVPVLVCDHRDYPTREAHEDAILDWLGPLAPEWIALAGYMRLVSPRLLGAFPGRVVNIHPADTRLHRGTGGYEWALREGLSETRVTVHLVDEGMDTGRIVLQATVPIEPDDTLETLTRRGLAVEHEAYVAALRILLGACGTPAGAADARDVRARTAWTAGRGLERARACDVAPDRAPGLADNTYPGPDPGLARDAAPARDAGPDWHTSMPVVGGFS